VTTSDAAQFYAQREAALRAAIAAEEAGYHLPPPTVRCMDCKNVYRYTAERWGGTHRCEACGGDGFWIEDGWEVDPKTLTAVERVRRTR
jgi:hypothetical protein